MACFADINVSQGSVATYARCGETFNIHLTANWPRNLPAILFKSRLGLTELWPWVPGPAFWPTLYMRKIYIAHRRNRGWQVGGDFTTEMELGHILWSSDPVTRESSDPLTRWPNDPVPCHLHDWWMPVLAPPPPLPSLPLLLHPCLTHSLRYCTFPTPLSWARRSAIFPHWPAKKCQPVGGTRPRGHIGRLCLGSVA